MTDRKTFRLIYEPPTQAQQDALREKHPDAIQLWRLDNCYATYGSNAVKTACVVLDIDPTLAMTMGGGIKEYQFDSHALDMVVSKLVKAGHRICIYEIEPRKDYVTE